MFLTTNRIDTFDPAFKSRIHLSIKYHPLCRDFRRQLWHNFIKSGATDKRDPSVLEVNFLEELANHDINGRQIRNIVRTAYALAVSDNDRLRQSHIRTTFTAMSVFEDEWDAAEVSTGEDAETTHSRSRKRRRLG